MRTDKISTVYKDVYIEYDVYNEEWIASLDTEILSQETIFKKHVSLKKLKEAIDRFLANNFEPIPISYFDSELNFVQADIISFTENAGECWIKKNDGTRSLIKTSSGISPKTIYSAGNIFNEYKMLKIFDLNDKKIQLQSQLEQIKKEIIETIASLEKYDISGLAVVNE